eukprot:CAMPEP_0202697006 /NCGR_PEP_ID=MMETSP1385-20130828/10340_1 /ASSEMBLY_ACC=CAM_ASM_000861 /TAXON_ID=933848 /ORGANISM="Elphidium margaritaceum" /LENGTH=529 /DNA_ID=CAMNT_0049353357 /DNA_START=36 /DNA_END=1625 /DNA_ORIENTATION=-
MMLARDTNQVQGLAKYALDFLSSPSEKLSTIDPAVIERVEMFHTDSVLCGLSALALNCNAPTVLRKEALETYATNQRNGATVFGSTQSVHPEKAVVANSCAVREWDSNGTVFGFNSRLGPKFQAGEFGHNDYYPSVVAASQLKQENGAKTILAMLLNDEIRGRLCEVFSLKSYKIDHVVHGAIATAVTYGAMLGATVEEIESAVGMVVAHYIPFRAIRAGHQLSDSKGASAAISSEVAMLCVHRSMNGFVGPKDILRNPQSIFRLFEPTESDSLSPFDIELGVSGGDFAVMGMHFKLGLYEHQSAGAIQALIDALLNKPEIVKNGADDIKQIAIKIYEPAFGIIGDPAKRDPTTRQSADHSMVYILASHLKKALTLGYDRIKAIDNNTDMWKSVMLLPLDYDQRALYDKDTRQLMKKIEFEHGGKEYDDNYPKGIPTKLSIETQTAGSTQSDMVMYPSGHARNTECDLKSILMHKWQAMAAITNGAYTGGDANAAQQIIGKLSNVQGKSADEIKDLYNIPINVTEQYKL